MSGIVAALIVAALLWFPRVCQADHNASRTWSLLRPDGDAPRAEQPPTPDLRLRYSQATRLGLLEEPDTPNLSVHFLSLDLAPSARLHAAFARNVVFSVDQLRRFGANAALLASLQRVTDVLLRLAGRSNEPLHERTPGAKIGPLLGFSRVGAYVHGWF